MNETVATVLGVIGAVMTVLSVTVAIFTFYFGRKKESTEEGAFKGVIQQDIKYIKEGVDELKHDNKSIKEDIRSLDHRVTLVEASAKSAHHRLDDQERRKEARHG